MGTTRVSCSLDTNTRNGQQIYDLACDGLHYLDTRTDFWRQQKPMYSRKREKQERLNGKQKKGNHEEYVINQLEKIDQGNKRLGLYYTLNLIGIAARDCTL